MVANLSEPHEFFKHRKGQDLFLFGEQGARTSLQQAHQEGVCKGLCGHLSLLCTGALVPAASAAQTSHVRAPLPGPAPPSVCSLLIPHHRMSLLSTNPTYLAQTLYKSQEGTLDVSLMASELLVEHLKHTSRSHARFALTPRTSLDYKATKTRSQFENNEGQADRRARKLQPPGRRAG